MELNSKQHSEVLRLLNVLGMDRIQLERLEDGCRYYAWRSGPRDRETKDGRLWSTLTIVEESSGVVRR